MPFASKKIQDSILPLGFAIIILLMISTAFQTANRVDAMNKAIHNIQSKSININNSLSIMSNSVQQRSVILFEMFQSYDPFKVDELMVDLHSEAERFITAREQFSKLDLSARKRELLSLQSKFSKQNFESISKLIDLLIQEDYKQATKILNDRTLPIMKKILNVIHLLQKEVQATAKAKAVETDKIVTKEMNSILFIHLTSILASFLLMLFLIRKQKKSNSDLSFLASRDTLTKLSNRENFIQHINNAMLKHPNSHFSIVFFDVDYFKSINDMHGHEVGDKVLKLFSRTINNLISKDDILARFGGDEFVLFLNNVNQTNEVKEFVSKVSKHLDTSYLIDGNEIYVTASIGAIDQDNFTECEALIRWTDDNDEYVNTGKFIEIAEKSNLIQKVNMYVIEEACRQQHHWQQNGIKNIRIHINLSGNKRIFSELFSYFSENLARYNLCPTLFGIELTERTIYEASDETNKELDHFRRLGMKISIDDFGTGYSSLSYLKNLPITSVKIDQSFVKGLPNEKIDVALVKTIISLAHSLDLDVVAEGVETQAQFDFLKSCNCNSAQGYLLHRPLSSEDISQLKLVA